MFYIKHHKINHLPFTSLHTVTCMKQNEQASHLGCSVPLTPINTRKLLYEHIIF